MSLLRFAVLMLAVGASDEGSIVKVHKLTFQGVHAIDEGLLRRSLATRGSPFLPWARKQFFDRTRFETDLKRVDAFYADHGYPDGHVTDFKVEFTDDQRSVDLTIVVSEGEPVRIAATPLRRLRRDSPRPSVAVPRSGAAARGRSPGNGRKSW